MNNPLDYEEEIRRLNHLGMLYAGAISELANGHEKAILPMNWPGLQRTRDMLQLILICRAELNGLVALLTKKGVFTTNEYRTQMAEEAQWLRQRKLEQFSEEDGVTYSSTPHGINIDLKRPEP